jgi:hypothetical protein
MNKKLTHIISIIKNNRYNNYEHLQKNAAMLIKSTAATHRFSKLFNDLLQLSKKVKQNTRVHNTIELKKKADLKKPIKHTPVSQPIPLVKTIIKKIPAFTNNPLFNTLMTKYDLYMVKVNKSRYDPYAEILMKALDRIYCVLPKEESISYLKKIKYEVVKEFNKKSIYKLYNYSPKHFKKSDLDDIFGNNKPVRASMLKVFADVFNCNLVYLENYEVKFITKFVDNLALIVITEDINNIYCLRTKNASGYIRSETLRDALGVNIKLYSDKLAKIPLGKLQNLSRMKNLDYKKPGKTKKINKTRQELIDELCRI